MARKVGAGAILLLMSLVVPSPAAIGAARFEAIAGDYQIDITRLGMPLVFYLRIGADGNFTTGGGATPSLR